MPESSQKTPAEQHIEEIMRELDPASVRYRVLNSARRFKSSWVELGEELHKISRQHLYRDWGYACFEEYCSREVRIRKATARKLTRAYDYLARKEPQLLRDEPRLSALPDYRTVDLLRQAQQEQQVTGEQYQALRDTALEQARSHPTVLKQFRQMTAADRDPREQRVLHGKAALSAVKRLLGSLEPLGDLADAYAEPLGELHDLLERELRTASATEQPKGQHNSASQ